MMSEQSITLVGVQSFIIPGLATEAQAERARAVRAKTEKVRGGMVKDMFFGQQRKNVGA